jgi:hypothetical protein
MADARVIPTSIAHSTNIMCCAERLFAPFPRTSQIAFDDYPDDPNRFSATVFQVMGKIGFTLCRKAGFCRAFLPVKNFFIFDKNI